MPGAFQPHAPGSARCGAIKGDKQPCRNPAGYGTTHPGYGRCKWHFGNTPSHRRLGARSLIRAEAYAICEARGVDPETISPEAVFREELARSYAIVAYLEEHSTPESLMWPDWQAVMLLERRHLLEVAKQMVMAGIAEREQRVLEEQAKALGGALRSILNQLELTPEQMRKAPIITAQVFGQLEAGVIEVTAS